VPARSWPFGTGRPRSCKLIRAHDDATRSLGAMTGWLQRIWQHPSAVLLAVQLVGVLLGVPIVVLTILEVVDPANSQVILWSSVLLGSGNATVSESTMFW